MTQALERRDSAFRWLWDRIEGRDNLYRVVRSAILGIDYVLVALSVSDYKPDPLIVYGSTFKFIGNILFFFFLYKARGFGMRVVGGKIGEDGRLFAYVVWTVPDGPAEQNGIVKGNTNICNGSIIK